MLAISSRKDRLVPLPQALLIVEDECSECPNYYSLIAEPYMPTFYVISRFLSTEIA